MNILVLLLAAASIFNGCCEAEISAYLCGTQQSYDVEVFPGDRVDVFSHESFDEVSNYTNEVVCMVRIKRGDGCGNLSVLIPFFNVVGNMTKDCLGGDYVQMEDDEEQLRLCGGTANNFNNITATQDFSLLFVTNSANTGPGFRIQMRCTNPSDESKSGRPPTCLCGKRRAAVRIVGGYETGVNEFPWQAGILMKSVGTKPVCGGTVMNTKWVMTAAHCMKSVSSPNAIEVDLGDHDVTSYTETEELIVGVTEIRMHPQYNAFTQDNDFALLKLDEVIVFSQHPNIRPICFPTIDPKAGETVIATGWGTLSEGGAQPAKLQELHVPVIDFDTCNDYYYGALTSNMMCAGDVAGGRDSCQGDSGGPLVYDNRGNYELVGVISFGNGCARAENPGVYAKTLASAAWWKSIIGSQEACPRS